MRVNEKADHANVVRSAVDANIAVALGANWCNGYPSRVGDGSGSSCSRGSSHSNEGWRNHTVHVRFSGGSLQV